MRSSAVKRERSTVQLRPIYSRFVHVWISFQYDPIYSSLAYLFSALNKVLLTRFPGHWVSLSVDLSLYVIFQYIIGPTHVSTVVCYSFHIELSVFDTISVRFVGKAAGEGRALPFLFLRFMDASRYELKHLQATLSRQGRAHLQYIGPFYSLVVPC